MTKAYPEQSFCHNFEHKIYVSSFLVRKEVKNSFNKPLKKSSQINRLRDPTNWIYIFPPRVILSGKVLTLRVNGQTALVTCQINKPVNEVIRPLFRAQFLTLHQFIMPIFHMGVLVLLNVVAAMGDCSRTSKPYKVRDFLPSVISLTLLWYFFGWRMKQQTIACLR